MCWPSYRCVCGVLMLLCFNFTMHSWSHELWGRKVGVNSLVMIAMLLLSRLQEAKEEGQSREKPQTSSCKASLLVLHVYCGWYVKPQCPQLGAANLCQNILPRDYAQNPPHNAFSPFIFDKGPSLKIDLWTSLVWVMLEQANSLS